MKRTFICLVMSALIFMSCNVQKRKHLSGYHVPGHDKIEYLAKANPSAVSLVGIERMTHAKDSLVIGKQRKAEPELPQHFVQTLKKRKESLTMKASCLYESPLEAIVLPQQRRIEYKPKPANLALCLLGMIIMMFMLYPIILGIVLLLLRVKIIGLVLLSLGLLGVLGGYLMCD